MHKKFSLIFSTAILFLVYTKCEECDKLGILLYEDLKCKPHIDEGKPCPTHYECEEFKKSNESCLFQSEKIPEGESVNDTLIYGTCRIGCRCIYDEYQRTDMASFNCAVLDCPEVFGDVLDGPDCYLTYKLDECCHIGQKCPPFDNITKCLVEGKEYKEGETFYPSNTCLNCICEKGFEGKFVEPFCKRRTCAEQIDNTDKLLDNCAPVYLGDDTLCCPSEWVCSSKSDHIKQINSKSSTDSNLTCRWGKRVLKLGEGLDTKVEHFGTVEDVTCECVLPPLLTCKKTK